MQKKSIIIIAIIVVVIAIALAAVWYFYFRTPSSFDTYAPATTPATEQSAQPADNTPSADSDTLSEGDTTADIAKDLDQTFDETAVNDTLNALEQDLQTF